MGANNIDLNKKLKEYKKKFESLEKDEKIAWGVLVLGIIIFIVALLMCIIK